MTKEKLEDLSLDRLRKRKKVGVVLLCVLIGAAILNINIIILLRDFIGEKQVDYSLLGWAFACLGGSTAIYAGIRKINGEICRRKNK